MTNSISKSRTLFWRQYSRNLSFLFALLAKHDIKIGQDVYKLEREAWLSVCEGHLLYFHRSKVRLFSLYNSILFVRCDRCIYLSCYIGQIKVFSYLQSAINASNSLINSAAISAGCALALMPISTFFMLLSYRKRV